MRLAFVLAGLGAGGAEKVINLIAHDRADRSDEVHVLAFGASTSQSYFPYDGRISVVVPGEAEGRLHRRLAVVDRTLWLRRQFRLIRPDLIVSFLTKANVMSLAAARGLGVPVVVSERNNPERQQTHPLWHLGTRRLLPRAEGIVMQTEDALAFLPEDLRGRASVIPNPCTLSRAATARPRTGCRIVATGRLEQQKGFDLLIEAFARIAPAWPDATLTIFGEGPLREALAAQIRAGGFEDRVRLAGVTHEPGAWIEEADIFVLSSRFEGFPNVLVEALAAGVPTAAFDCPWGPRDIITDGVSGLLVPAEDVPALAHSLDRLLSDPELRSALAAAGRAAVERFEPSVVLAQWDAVIRAAVASGAVGAVRDRAAS